MARRATRAWACAVALLLAGCASIGQVTTLGDAQCRRALEDAFATIFTAQREEPQVAAELATSTTAWLRTHGVGPRPFVIASPSGADYSFFVQPAEPACLLRLYGRQKGFVSYTNDITFIETAPLPACRCSE